MDCMNDDHTLHVKKTIVIRNAVPCAQKCQSLLVAFACLLGGNLALGVLNGPCQQQAESHTAHLLVLHAVKELLAGLLAGLRRCQAECAGNLGCTGQECVELAKGENTSGSAVALSEDSQQELIQRCMCSGVGVGDGLLEVGQVLLLVVLLNVVVVHICGNVNGCHLGDQVI